MKARISRAELSRIIGNVQGIVPNKPSIPILANVHVAMRHDQCTLSTTDLTISAKTEMRAEVTEEGGITLPAKSFFQLIRELHTPEITLSTSGKSAAISSGNALFRFNGVESDAFPTFPDLSEAIPLDIDGKSLKEMLAHSSFAAAREESRQVLHGVSISTSDGKISAIGTDGKRLAKISRTIAWRQPHQNDCVIPLKAVEEMGKILDEERGARLMFSPEKREIGLESGDATLVTKLLAGHYPEIEQVMPMRSKQPIHIHREECMALLKQVSLFRAEKNQSAQFTFSKGDLTLKAASEEIGEGRVSMPVDHSDEEVTITFNPLYFYEILRHCQGEVVALSITDAYNPALITDSPDAEFVLMPMRPSST